MVAPVDIVWKVNPSDNFGENSCAATAQALQMISPSETGTTQGQLGERGKNRETGAYRGCLAPVAGARRREAR
jgi:hypothetical protein